MKKYFFASTFLVFAVAFSASATLAQSTSKTKPRYKLSAPEDDSPTETTLDIDEGAFLGYAGLRWGARSFGDKWVSSNGMRGMWLFRESIAFGVDFASVTGRLHPFKDKARERITQGVVTWGLAIERIMNHRKEFHWHAGGTVGRGQTKYMVGSGTLPKDLADSRMFYFVSPEVGLRWNLTKYTRPFIVASTLLPFGGTGNDKVKTDELSGLSLLIGVNVGNFVL